MIDWLYWYVFSLNVYVIILIIGCFVMYNVGLFNWYYKCFIICFLISIILLLIEIILYMLGDNSK